MTPTLTRFAGAVVAIVLAIAATPAHAASETYRDAVKDVTVSNDHSEKVDPNATDPDIIRTRNTHGTRMVTTKVTLRDLGYGGHQVAMQVNTPHGSYTVRGTKGGVFKDEVVVVPPPSRTVPCSGGSFRVDRKRATMTLRVPRRCVGNPRWVRIGVATMALSRGGVAWVDDSRGKGLLLHDQLRLGPRLTRG